MSNKTVRQLKEVSGMMTCMLEHQVTSTQAKFEWTGPKINREVWEQVLAFFSWTYKEHHSESQVRLFVNHKTKVWAAWAFPQEARTGMTAKELDVPSAKEQRAQFSDADGWVYFGTVHHHCGGGAFQSGTDETNESNQDGLHITVGKMDEKMHDIHCRLYISGHKFEPRMHWFWDIEPTLAPIPTHLRALLADGVEDRLARMQMCMPVGPEVKFPDQWRDNVIEIKTVSSVGYNGGLGYRGYGQGYGLEDDDYVYSRSHKTPPNGRRDLFIARKELIEFFADKKNKLHEFDPISSMETLLEFPHIIELFANFYRNDVSIHALINYMKQQEEKELKKELEAEQKIKGGKGREKVKGKVKDTVAANQHTGIPDYKGDGGNDFEGYAPGMLLQ